MDQYKENKLTYLTIQLRLAYYHFLVLSTYYIIKTNRFELSRLQILSKEKCICFVMKRRKVKQIMALLDTLVMFYYKYNLIVVIQKTFRLVNSTVVGLNKFMEIDLHSQGPRLGSLIYIKFFDFISLIGRVASSVGLLRDNLMFDVRKVVALPVRIKTSFSKCKNEVRNFWLQIEQIFLILRLPIEFLSLIGRFLAHLISWLSTIEKPKVPKI